MQTFAEFYIIIPFQILFCFYPLLRKENFEYRYVILLPILTKHPTRLKAFICSSCYFFPIHRLSLEKSRQKQSMDRCKMEENSIGKNLLSHRRCIKLMPRRIISQLFRVKHTAIHIRTYHT